MRERIAFWLDSDIANEVRQRLLDHKVETGERLTITDICTRSLIQYLKEATKMRNTYNDHSMAKTVTGVEVIMPDNFDLRADYESPRSYTAIRKGIWGNPDRKVRVKVDHDATGTGTTGTGDTVVRIC